MLTPPNTSVRVGGASVDVCDLLFGPATGCVSGKASRVENTRSRCYASVAECSGFLWVAMPAEEVPLP